MSEEEQEKLYDLLFKDTKNKLEATIEEQQNKIESLQKEIKLMKSININDNYISKDEIKEKIKYYKDIVKYTGSKTYKIYTIVETLQELLEE